MKRDLTFAVDPSLYPHIHGTTDPRSSSISAHAGPPRRSDRRRHAAVQMIESVGREHGINFPMQGTMALSDGRPSGRSATRRRGSRTLFHSQEIDTLREMYPEVERLNIFGRRARVVVSEPLNDLPGAFIEVPESTVAILGESGYAHEPSSPTRRRSRAGPGDGCPAIRWTRAADAGVRW